MAHNERFRIRFDILDRVFLKIIFNRIAYTFFTPLNRPIVSFSAKTGYGSNISYPTVGMELNRRRYMGQMLTKTIFILLFTFFKSPFYPLKLTKAEFFAKNWSLGTRNVAAHTNILPQISIKVSVDLCL